MTSNDLFKIITDFTTVYRAGAGLPPLKAVPQEPKLVHSEKSGQVPAATAPDPEVSNGSDEDLDDYEPDRYDWPDDHKTDDPRHGQAEGLNKLR